MLVSLALVLGYFDRAIPITMFLSGVIPGIKLGLANTVLLYAIYLLDWRSAILLMLAKVGLGAWMYGSLTSMLIGLAGGALSLVMMLLVAKNGKLGGLLVSGGAAYGFYCLINSGRKLQGQNLTSLIMLIAVFAVGIFVLVLAIFKPQYNIIGTSLVGGVSHNVGQLLAYVATIPAMQRPLMARTLFGSYLPFLIGMGGIVGCLTGIVARRVCRVLRALPEEERRAGAVHRAGTPRKEALPGTGVGAVAGAAAARVAGVARLGAFHSQALDALGRATGRHAARGVRVQQDGENVDVDIAIVAEYGAVLPEVVRDVCEQVKQAVKDSEDIDLRSVNVRVSGISPDPKTARLP